MTNEAPKTISLGLRVEPNSKADRVHWAIVRGTSDAPELVARDTIKAPSQGGEPAALTWFRERVLHLIEEYSPQIAAVRYPESNARATNQPGPKRRTRIEGVLVQAVHGCGLPVLTGALNTVGANLGSKKPKNYLAQDDLRELDWSDVKSVPLREAILVGASVLSRAAEVSA